jgi:glycosyltransferase involved in cell wall biosynthesis
MIGAVGRLPEPLGAELRLGGTVFPEGLDAALRELPGAARTRWLGYLGRPAVAALLDAARVGLVVLRDTPQYREAYPTKLFEYMAAGVPAVVSDFPLWREMVEGAGCGLLVDPLDEAAISAACERLLTDDALAQRLGDAGRRAARERYAWAGEAERLLAFYAALVERRAPGEAAGIR